MEAWDEEAQVRSDPDRNSENMEAGQDAHACHVMQTERGSDMVRQMREQERLRNLAAEQARSGFCVLNSQHSS